MPKLRDYFFSDVDNVFFNSDELAEMRDIDGKQILAIIDEDELTERKLHARQGDYYSYDGVYTGTVLVSVKSADLGYRPVIDQHMKLDGKLYLVKDCSEVDGMLEIALEANKA